MRKIIYVIRDLGKYLRDVPFELILVRHRVVDRILLGVYDS